MKTLRDLAKHIREWGDDSAEPSAAILYSWATEMDQCLDQIKGQAELAIERLRWHCAAIHASPTPPLIAQAIDYAQDIIDETTSGYVTTKHENPDDKED